MDLDSPSSRSRAKSGDRRLSASERCVLLSVDLAKLALTRFLANLTDSRQQPLPRLVLWSVPFSIDPLDAALAFGPANGSRFLSGFLRARAPLLRRHRFQGPSP